MVYRTFLLNFINFCLFVQKLRNKNQGGPVIIPCTVCVTTTVVWTMNVNSNYHDHHTGTDATEWKSILKERSRICELESCITFTPVG